MIGIKIIKKAKTGGSSASGINTSGVNYGNGLAKEAAHAAKADVADFASNAEHAATAEIAIVANHATMAHDLDSDSPIRSEFLSKKTDDTAEGYIRFLKGFAIGGATFGVDADGNAVLKTLKIGDCTLSYNAEKGALGFDKSIYSEGSLSALGMGDSTGGGGSTGFDRLDFWKDYSTDLAAYVLSAKLGIDLNTRLKLVEGGSATSVLTNERGNVVTSISKEGNVITVNKDITALTEHQPIFGLTIQGNGTSLGTYTPNSAAKTINITAANVGAALASHTHPLAQITDLHANWGALLKATPSIYVTRWPTFGEVTSKPTTLAGYGITDGVNALTVGGSGNAITAASLSGHKLTLTKGATYLPEKTFTDLFEKVEIGTDADGKTVYAIRAKLGLYSDSFVSALGKNDDTGGGGSSLDRLDDWKNYDPKGGDVLSAVLGYGLKTDISGLANRVGSLEGTAFYTLTIQRNGVAIGTYDPKSAAKTINVVVPTKVGELTNDKSYATTSDVDTRISNLVAGAPEAFDTLKEIADVLEGNVDSIGDILTTLGTKADKAVTISAGAGLTGGGSLAANRTIALATVGAAGTYTKVTVDAYGRVTAHASLAATDIPALAISKITGLQTALDGKVTTARKVTAGNGLTGGGALSADITLNVVSANTGITVGADSITLNTVNSLTSSDTVKPLSAAQGKVIWDFVKDLFTKVSIGKDADGKTVWAIQANYGLYSNSFVSALGLNGSEGGGGVGYNRLDTFDKYSDDYDDYVLSAKLGYDLYLGVNGLTSSVGGLTSSVSSLAARVGSLEGGSAMAVNVTGAGNVVSSVSKSGTTIEVVKGFTAAAASHTHPLANLTDLNASWATLLKAAPSAYITRWPSWTEVSGKPTTFAPSAHTHTIAQISDLHANWDALLKVAPTAYLTRWPTLSEIGAAAASHTHVIGALTDLDEGWDALLKAAPSAFVTRWPAWGEVTGKPSTFAPSAHTHPLSQISDLHANWDALLKVTPSAYIIRWPSFSEVTSRPTTLSGYGITDGVNSLTVSGSGNAVTGASLSGHTLTLTKGATYLPKDTFDKMFVKENIGTDAAPVWAIHALFGLYTDSFISALGANVSEGGGVSYNRLDTFEDYKSDYDDYVLSAKLGHDLYNGVNGLSARITSLEGGSATTVETTGGGNVVSAVVKSGTVITVTKGFTAAAASHTHPLSQISDLHANWDALLKATPSAYLTRWPSWTEVTGKPSTFAPSAHTHTLAQISDLHANWDALLKAAPTTFVTRWPAWGEVTGKPSTFAPSAHNHSWGNILSPSQAALDNVKGIGFQATYGGGSNTITGKPSGVDAFGLISLQSASGYYTQLMRSVNANVGWLFRDFDSQKWGAWKWLLDSDNSSLSGSTVKINGVSATFSLSTHTHTFASLTSKPTTLAGFGITDGVNAVTVSGTGNVITSASVGGNALTLTKGITALTAHQAIYGLTVQGNGTPLGTYTPNSAAKTINVTYANVGAAAASHTHPLSQISDLHANWDALLKVTPSAYIIRWPSFSEVTSKPTTLSGYGITDGVNALTVGGSGNAVTAASLSGHKLTLTKGETFLAKATFDDLFVKENIGTAAAPVYAIKARYGLYSTSFVSAMGLNGDSGGGGAYNRLDKWEDYDAESTVDYVLSALLGYDLNTRVNGLSARVGSLEGGSATTVVVSGSGNVVASISKSGTTITAVKGTVAAASHSHPISQISDLHANWDALLKAAPSAYMTRWPSWTEVTGKPSTFAPSAHTHTIAQISDLHANWDALLKVAPTAYLTRWPTLSEIGAAAASHSHPLSQISDLHANWDALLKATPSGYVTRWPSFSEVTSRPTTLAGYGITDAPTKTGSGASGTWGINVSGTASKWTAARRVNIGGFGSCYFDISGAADVSFNYTPYNFYVSKGSTNNYPWHRIAKLGPIANAYYDGSVTLMLVQGYNGGKVGMVKIDLRTNDSKNVSTASAKWLTRQGFAVDAVQLGLYNVYGKTYVDVFYHADGGYAGTSGIVMVQGGRGTLSRAFTLVNSAEASGTTTTDKKTSTECWKTIAEAGTDLHGQAYSVVGVAVEGGSVASADTLDGVHLNGIFTALANSGNNLSLTIGGVTKTLTVNYASTCNIANRVANNLSFVAGTFAVKNFSGSAAVTVNIPTKTSNLTNDSGFVNRWPAWGEVTGKPSTFAPSAHTHTIAQISDLHADWDALLKVTPSAYLTRWPSWTEVTGKPSTFAPSAHTHTFASLTSKPTTIAGYGITDAPTKTGSGASGTWGISVSGNAASATKLQTARTLWGQSFNGTGNVSGAMSGVTSLSASSTIYSATNINCDGPVRCEEVNLGIDSVSYSKIGNYPEINSGGNELVFGGTAAEMIVNYRTSAKRATKITQWTWMAGASDVYANFVLGNLTTNGTIDSAIGSWYIHQDGASWFNSVGTNAGIYCAKDISCAGNIKCDVDLKCATSLHFVNGDTVLGTVRCMDTQSYIQAGVGTPLWFGWRGGRHSLTIDKSGNVNIGTAATVNASYKLNVDGSINAQGNISATGGVSALTTSDRRLKRNIHSLDALGVIRSMGGVWEFDYTETGRHGYGLIAQEVKRSVMGDIVKVRKDGYLAIDYLDTRLISLAIGAVAEIDGEVVRLKRRVAALESEIERLTA